MDTRNILILIIGVLVGAVVLSAFVPVIMETQKVSGAVVEYDNVQSGYTYQLTEKNENVTITITGANGDIYFNGEVISDDGFAIVTDTVTVRASTSIKGLNVATPTQQLDLRVPWSSNFTITFIDGTCTITNNIDDVGEETVQYSWMYSPSDDGEWVTVTGSTTHYVNSIKDVICSGYYSTGENDTGYYVRDGIAKVSDPDYTAGLTYTLNPVSGTTDVYTLASLNVNVGEESFTPWFLLVKKDIIGHEASGTMFDLFGILPLIAGVGLLLFVVTEVFRRYY